MYYSITEEDITTSHYISHVDKEGQLLQNLRNCVYKKLSSEINTSLKHYQLVCCRPPQQILRVFNIPVKRDILSAAVTDGSGRQLQHPQADVLLATDLVGLSFSIDWWMMPLCTQYQHKTLGKLESFLIDLVSPKN